LVILLVLCCTFFTLLFKFLTNYRNSKDKQREKTAIFILFSLL
jgi:ABC-type Mn2+/Zn2+ transport system permease subunit